MPVWRLGKGEESHSSVEGAEELSTNGYIIGVVELYVGTYNRTIILRREGELCIMCVAYRIAGTTTATLANDGFLKV